MPHILTATSEDGKVVEYKLARYVGVMHPLTQRYSIVLYATKGYEAAVAFEDFSITYEEAKELLWAYIQEKLKASTCEQS